MSELKMLTGIDMESGTAMDDPEHYRGFLIVRATAEDGSVLVGQLNPDEVRAMALQWLEAAEAAEQDRIVMTMLTRDIGIDPPTAARFVSAMRDERDGKVGEGKEENHD